MESTKVRHEVRHASLHALLHVLLSSNPCLTKPYRPMSYEDMAHALLRHGLCLTLCQAYALLRHEVRHVPCLTVQVRHAAMSYLPPCLTWPVGGWHALALCVHIKQSTLFISEVHHGSRDSHGAHLASPRMRCRREKCYQLLLAVISQ